MRMTICISLAITMLSGAAFADTNTLKCVGTRHKGTDKPVAFSVEVTGESSAKSAEAAGRLAEESRGWTVDSLTCPEPVNAADAGWRCKGWGTCWVDNGVGQPIQSAADYKVSEAVSEAAAKGLIAGKVMAACKALPHRGDKDNAFQLTGSKCTWAATL